MKKQFLSNFHEMNFVQYYVIESFCNLILLMLFHDSIFQHDALLLGSRFEELADVFTLLIKTDSMYVMNTFRGDCITESSFQGDHDLVLVFQDSYLRSLSEIVDD